MSARGSLMSTQERKTRDREKRRRAILDAARHVFFEHGFNNTSMEMIANRCQLAKGTIYLYFKNKESLYVSLVEDGVLLLKEMMQEAIRPGYSIEKKLLTIADVHYRFSVEHREYFSVLLAVNAGSIVDKVDPEELRCIRSSELRNAEPVVELFRTGISHGLFRADLDPEYAVVMLWVSMCGAIMLAQNAAESELMRSIDAGQLVRDVVLNLVEGYKKRPA